MNFSKPGVRYANIFFTAVISLVFILSSWTVIAAQSAPPPLDIVIKDANGAVVAGANLTITGKNGIVRTAATDRTGSGHFANLPDGEYRVKVEAPGFPTVLRDVTVNAGASKEIDIVLQLGTITEDVTVTATRTQVTSE